MPDADGEPAIDVDGITLLGTEFKVSASEKVSTGKYENYSPDLTVEGKLPSHALEDEATRAALKEKLLRLHGDLQDVLSRAAGNRTAEPEWETWTFQEAPDPEVTSVDEHEAETDGGEDDG